MFIHFLKLFSLLAHAAKVQKLVASAGRPRRSLHTQRYMGFRVTAIQKVQKNETLDFYDHSLRRRFALYSLSLETE